LPRRPVSAVSLDPGQGAHEAQELGPIPHPGDPLESSPSRRRQHALRAGLSAPRPSLPPRQRRLKAGTTGFMLAMHVGAVAALLPRFWSWQGLVVLAVL
jgi:hypothetical protein